MADLFDKDLNVLEVLVGLVQFIWRIYLFHKPDHMLNCLNWALYVISLDNLRCILHQVEIQKLTEIVNEYQWIDLVCKALIEFAILTDVNEREVLSDPGEENINLLTEDFCVLIRFWNGACNENALQDLFKSMLF